MGIFNGTEEEKKYKLLIKAIKTSKKNNEIISYLITYLENVRNNKINNDFIEFDTLESVVIELINMNIENVSELKQHFDNFVKIFKIIMPAGVKTPNYEFKKNMYIFNFISVNGLIENGLFNERIYSLFENDGDYLFFMNLIKNDTSLLNKVETIYDYMCRVAPFCSNGTILKNELISYIHAIDTVVGDLESFTNERIKEAKKRAGIYPINEKTLATISAEAEKAQALVVKLESLQKEVDDYSEIVLNRSKEGLSTIQSATLDGKNEIEKLSSFTIKTMQDYIAKVKKDIVSQLDEYLKSLEETLKISSDKVFNQVLIDAQEKIRSIKIAAESLTNTTTTELIRIQQASEESVSKLKSYVENAPQVKELLEQAKKEDKLRETLLSLKVQGQTSLVDNEKQVGIHIPGNDRIVVPANPKVVVPSQMEDIKILPAFDESIPFDVRMKKILEEKKRREHNGEIFHEMTEEVLRCVMEGDWVYLWGPSGCGKSYVIKQVASLLGIDMIDEANSGHPGIVLGAAPIITTLYANHMKIDLENDKWLNRDRFVMSAGHGSALLYATLFMSGFDIPFEELKKFRQLDSLTPGHPEINVTKGIDVSTGPLGQGIATSVGIALSECYLRQYFGKDIVNYYTYVLCGDGDLMEGISYEACSLAGFLELDKLIVLYDSNDVTLDGAKKLSFNENIKERFESINWNYILVNDGEDTTSIDEAITKAKAVSNKKPTIIEIKTVIGKYSKNEGTSTVHGSPLAKEDIINIKKKLGLREVPFTISLEAKNLLQEKITTRNSKIINEWNEKVSILDETTKKELTEFLDNKKSIKFKDIYYEFPKDGKDSTRNVSGKIINSIAQNYPFLIGGSADVSKSTTARINDTLDFSPNTPAGRNINFGIREHAMAAIGNGMALCNLTPFVSTFFSFSDYLKPSIRMSALMDLPIIYVFTHDSISVGEDGPTHQPIEQLVSLRALPNFDTYRPADANEVIGTYKAILELRKPAAIILGRNKVKIQDSTSSSDVIKGAYIVKKELKKLEGIIISTGEELELAMNVYNNLLEKGYGIRLVSMPSMERFEKMDKVYKNDILPKGVKTFVIEASSSLSWYKYVTGDEYMFTIDDFGSSGKRYDVLDKYGFNVEKIEKQIEKKLNEDI